MKRIFNYKKNNKHNSKYCAYLQESLFNLLNLLPIVDCLKYRFKISDIEIKIGERFVIVTYDDVDYHFNNVTNNDDYDLTLMTFYQDNGHSFTEKVDELDFRIASYYTEFLEMKNKIDFCTFKEICNITKEIKKQTNRHISIL